MPWRPSPLGNTDLDSLEHRSLGDLLIARVDCTDSLAQSQSQRLLRGTVISTFGQRICVAFTAAQSTRSPPPPALLCRPSVNSLVKRICFWSSYQNGWKKPMIPSQSSPKGSPLPAVPGAELSTFSQSSSSVIAPDDDLACLDRNSSSSMRARERISSLLAFVLFLMDHPTARST